MSSPAELSPNALRVLEARYLLRDAGGDLTEDADGMFRRVAGALARAEDRFGDSGAAARWEQRFCELMSSLDFLPNSPTLMNAGLEAGQLSACFVLPVGNSLRDALDCVKLAALIQQGAGGTGFSFSDIAPQGDPADTGAGPLAFLRLFNMVTETVLQSGKRRGANMGVLRVDHPDIFQFIDAKRNMAELNNFNLSVGVTDAFMQAAEGGGTFALRHPHTGRVVQSVSAAELLEKMTRAAWASGEPGVLFLDAIERGNPIAALGAISATNPCGEIPLLPYEACNLGSINLRRMTRSGGTGQEIDWKRLRDVTHVAARLLDDVIEVNQFPDERITRAVRHTRKIGLGVMGFAELLILLGIPYTSPDAVRVAEEVMRFVAEEAHAASLELARERGPFPGSRSLGDGAAAARNATRTAVAPTGTLSLIAGTSPSIEPLFALAFRREHVLGGQSLLEVNPLLLKELHALGMDTGASLQELEQTGALSPASGVPEELRTLFVTALDIPPHQHLAIQAAFQQHVDNAVSKTINLPQSASVEDAAQIYRSAWELGVKGVTLYRYGSRDRQVLHVGAAQAPFGNECRTACDVQVQDRSRV